MDDFDNQNFYYDPSMDMAQRDNRIPPSRNPQQFPNPGGGSIPNTFPQGINFGTMPPSAPPNFVPTRQITPFRVDPASIRNCMRRFTYVWLDNGSEFWMFPIQLSRNSISGFRWNRPFGWTFFGVSLDRIDSFMCV